MQCLKCYRHAIVTICERAKKFLDSTWYFQKLLIFLIDPSTEVTAQPSHKTETVKTIPTQPGLLDFHAPLFLLFPLYQSLLSSSNTPFGLHPCRVRSQCRQRRALNERIWQTAGAVKRYSYTFMGLPALEGFYRSAENLESGSVLTFSCNSCSGFEWVWRRLTWKQTRKHLYPTGTQLMSS